MAFDYLGAKKAGISDEQVSAALQKRGINFDFAAARKAGVNDDQINSALASKTSQTTDASQASTPTQPKTTGVLDTLANLLGVGTTAKNIKLAAGAPQIGQQADQTKQLADQTFQKSQALIKEAQQTTDPVRKKQLLDASRGLDQGMDPVASDLQRNIENLVKSGGVNQADLTVGSNAGFALKRGSGTAAEAASVLLPGTKEFEAASLAAKSGGIPARVANAATTGAIQGGLQGEAQAATDSNGVLDMVKKTLTGAGTGAATSALMQTGVEGINGLSDTFNKTTGKAKQVARDLYGSTLKQNVGDQKFYQQAGGIDKVVDDAIRLKIPPTKEGVRQELQNFGSEFSQKVDTELAKSKAGKQTVDIAGMYQKAKDATLNQLKDPESRQLYAQAKNYFDAADKVYLADNNKSVTLDAANRLRKRLDGRVGEMLTQDIGNGELKAMKTFATELRNTFKTEMPQLKDTFRKYQLLSGMAESMQKEPTLGITEIAAAAPGMMHGNPAIAAGSLLAAKTIRSPGFKRNIASGLANLLANNKNIDTTRQVPEVLRSLGSVLAARSSVN